MNGIVIAGLFLAMAIIMVILVIWARRRTTGAVATGALLSVFAPDPTLEANIRLANEAKQEQAESEENGEPK